MKSDYVFFSVSLRGARDSLQSYKKLIPIELDCRLESVKPYRSIDREKKRNARMTRN